MTTLALRCPECDAETDQRVTKRFTDGSGYTKCDGCGYNIVHMGGTIPAEAVA